MKNDESSLGCGLVFLDEEIEAVTAVFKYAWDVFFLNKKLLRHVVVVEILDALLEVIDGSVVT